MIRRDMLGPMIGNWIGPYKIVRELPQDRVGRVYEAVDAAGKKRFQIKSLRPEAASQPGLVSRLYSEAHTLALLNHEHIARLFGFIRRDDGLYLVMEFVEGENLKKLLLDKSRLDLAVALAFFRQILSAVDFAHRLGVIHGDLNSANVIVTDFARIKVLDFAIGAILGNSDAVANRVCSASHMSPEQIEGAAVGVRSDIYSLGVLLYELVVGKVPFTTAVEPKARSQSMPLLPSLIVCNIPNWLDVFLLRALAVSPEDRFPSVAVMSRAMGAAVETHTIKAERKPGSLRALHGLHQVPLRPTNLRKSADQRRRSSNAVLTNFITNSPKSALRPRQFFARVRHFAVIISPAPWAKRQITGALAWMHQIAAAIEELPSVAFARFSTRSKKIAGHPRFRRHSSRGGASNGILAIRSEAIDRSGLKLTGDWARQWIKKTSNALSESGWKRYVVLAFLLFSVFVEAFVFQGANTLFSPALDPASIHSASRNGAAQTLLSETPHTATAIAVREHPAPEVKVVKRSPKAPRTAEEKPNRPSEDMHHLALDSKRTVVYRVPRPGSQTDRTRLHEYRVNEPAKRNPETSTARTQLNIRWEN